MPPQTADLNVLLDPRTMAQVKAGTSVHGLCTKSRKSCKPMLCDLFRQAMAIEDEEIQRSRILGQHSRFRFLAIQ